MMKKACSTCVHWEGTADNFMAGCPKAARRTEFDFTCGEWKGKGAPVISPPAGIASPTKQAPLKGVAQVIADMQHAQAQPGANQQPARYVSPTKPDSPLQFENVSVSFHNPFLPLVSRTGRPTFKSIQPEADLRGTILIEDSLFKQLGLGLGAIVHCAETRTREHITAACIITKIEGTPDLKLRLFVEALPNTIVVAITPSKEIDP
jgi:hypothetical protein